ncbi:Hypothetical protein CINCED_3A002961 [Cinara cedri]|uniref:Uncharacterized protein n=1 Tax=Cinara cedri TaxID=506608 RepID=A0A5E4N3T4_9HEMI|nr:Hypothetical protein CINCED_3A002961 [Cinara cedri]
MNTPAVYSLVLLALLASVLTYPYAGGNNNNQWSNPRVGMQQQQQGYNGGRGQSNGYNGGNQRGFGGNNFGQSGGYPQSGGRQPGQGSESYHTHVFNEPDRYGYDYTMPGATVHYLMHKKQGNRGSGNSGSYGGY